MRYILGFALLGVAGFLLMGTIRIDGRWDQAYDTFCTDNSFTDEWNIPSSNDCDNIIGYWRNITMWALSVAVLFVAWNSFTLLNYSRNILNTVGVTALGSIAILGVWFSLFCVMFGYILLNYQCEAAIHLQEHNYANPNDCRYSAGFTLGILAVIGPGVLTLGPLYGVVKLLQRSTLPTEEGSVSPPKPINLYYLPVGIWTLGAICVGMLVYTESDVSTVIVLSLISAICAATWVMLRLLRFKTNFEHFRYSVRDVLDLGDAQTRNWVPVSSVIFVTLLGYALLVYEIARKIETESSFAIAIGLLVWTVLTMLLGDNLYFLESRRTQKSPLFYVGLFLAIIIGFAIEPLEASLPFSDSLNALLGFMIFVPIVSLILGWGAFTSFFLLLRARYDDTLKRLTQNLRWNPLAHLVVPDHFTNLGADVLFYAGRFEEFKVAALDILSTKENISIDPSIYARVTRILSLTEQYQGNSDSARQLMNIGHKLTAKNNISALEEVVLLHLEQEEELDKAKEILDIILGSLKRRPNLFGVKALYHGLHAWLLAHQGADIEEFVQRGISKMAGYPLIDADFHYRVGRAYMVKNNHERGLEHLNKAIELDPDGLQGWLATRAKEQLKNNIEGDPLNV